jgi:RNA polymerase sigma factor (sigma-70 family)
LQDLWTRHHAGEKAALDELLKRYAEVAWIVAIRMKRGGRYEGASIDEMASDGLLGVLSALRRPDAGEPFFKKAYSFARAYIGHHHRRRLGLSGYRNANLAIARRVRSEMIQSTGIVPTEAELSARLAGMIRNPNIVVEGRARIRSLSEIDRKREGERPRTVIDPDAEMPMQRLLDRETVKLAMRGLKQKDRIILRMLLRGHTEQEIGKKLQISHARVWQRLNGVVWEARARADLCRHLDTEPVETAFSSQLEKELTSPWETRRRRVG